MKLSDYSLNYSARIARGEMDVFRFLSDCRALGLDGASLHVRDLPGTDEVVLARVRRAMLDQGLSLGMVTASTDFGVADDRQAEPLDRVREGIKVALYLGAPLLRVFAGAAGPGAWPRAVAGVRRACDEAARDGIPIGLQNHNHGGLCASGDEVVRFLKEVDHPNLTFVLDCGQFRGSAGASGSKGGTRPDELLENIRKTSALARHVRVKFYRPGPDGSEPDIPYDDVLEILRGVHYPGFLDIVYEPDRAGGVDAREAMPRIVAFLRSRLAAEPHRAGPSRDNGRDAGRVLVDTDARTETAVAFLEGPTVDRAGIVHFSNVAADRIMTWDPSRRKLGVFREKSGGANGLIFDRDGRLLACEGTGRVTRTDVATGRVEVLADSFGGHPLGAPNDLDVDGLGRIYFTSRLSNTDPSAGNINAVYRIDLDGTVTRILAAPAIDMPNGIAIAPNDATLYLIDSDGGEGRARRIRAYDLRADGTTANERMLYDFAPGRGGDGMAIDSEGNLYVAAGLHRRRGTSETLDTRPGVHVISPAGKRLAFVETPEDLVTNCAFGAPDRRTLFVTCGKLLLSLRTKIPGRPLS